MIFGDILKALREDKDLNQGELAKYMNVDRSTVGKWESNSSKPDYEKLIRLADYFNVTTDYLLGRTDRPNNNNNEYNEPQTIAAHFDGDEYTDEDLRDIENFKKWVKDRNKK